MKHEIRITLLSILAGATLVGCEKDNDNVPPTPEVNAVVVKSSGDSASIVNKLNEFRLLAGDPVNNNPGATGGRREVNWDGTPANVTNNNSFPVDFFGSFDPQLGGGRKRGLILSGSNNSFRLDSTGFEEIEPSYATQFKFFSKKKLFSPAVTNQTVVTFKVPGTNTDAFVHGFGVIFSDVDDANLTTVEYFSGNKSLGVYKPTAANGGFSFLGVGFPDEKVTRVVILTGNTSLGLGKKDVTNGGQYDVVVMDDFIYDEPQPIVQQ